MQIHTELDDQHYLKLQQLQSLLDKDINQLLSAAIDHLYNQHNIAVGSEALTILNKNGFVGCLQDDAELSQQYKERLDWGHKL